MSIKRSSTVGTAEYRFMNRVMNDEQYHDFMEGLTKKCLIPNTKNIDCTRLKVPEHTKGQANCRELWTSETDFERHLIAVHEIEIRCRNRPACDFVSRSGPAMYRSVHLKRCDMRLVDG